MDIFLLSILQGVTEFLPISSSAHLLLLSSTNEMTPSVALKLAFHLGTLGAIVIYFWRDLWGYFQGSTIFVRQRVITPAFQEALYLCLATVPAVCVGYIVHRWGPFIEENLTTIGINSIVFGGLLIYADRTEEQFKTVSLKNSFLLGLGQVFALIFPGASRSGSCLTIGRFLKINRYQSIRFTFLLSIPTVFAGIVLVFAKNPHYTSVEITEMVQAAGLSFVVALCVIHFVLHILNRQGFKYFGIYRIILGLYLLWIA